MDLSRRNFLKLIGITPLATKVPRRESVQEQVQQEDIAQKMLSMHKSHEGCVTAFCSTGTDYFMWG